MKSKKFTMSKLVLLIPYGISLSLLVCMFMLSFKESNPTYLNYIEIAFVGSLGLAGYVTKWYSKKAALENEPKIRLGVIQSTIELARKNPDLKIYDTVQIKRDIEAIINPIKQDEQKNYEKMITDDLDVKISQ